MGHVLSVVPRPSADWPQSLMQKMALDSAWRISYNWRLPTMGGIRLVGAFWPGRAFFIAELSASRGLQKWAAGPLFVCGDFAVEFG
jgi:hypothetical protein